MAYLTQLQSSTLSNQNISSALLLATFTNTTRLRKLFIDVFADQIAGNGDYVVYATRQRSGAGAAYEIGARTTVAVPSGVTSQMFPTIALTCGATDVIKIYLVGLAGDTTTPDTIVEVSEEFINTDASGNPTPNDSSGITTLLTRIVGTLLTGNHNPQSGDAYARVGANGAGLTALGDTRLANLDATVSSRSTLTAAQVDTQLSASHGAGTWGAGGNGGALTLTYTLTSSVDSSAIQGATIELYAEVGMVTLIDSQVTNALGQCTFSDLVAGTYYLKRIKSGWTFGNPDTETVS